LIRLDKTEHQDLLQRAFDRHFQYTDQEVKSPSTIDRFLVVFHSPTGMAETGLLARRSEKTGRAPNVTLTRWIFSGPV
jgi:hypothetical protein